MIKLSSRLNSIYDMIEPNLNVCDLCSDHGLIPIKLITNNKSNKVIVTDINQSSIEKINNNVELYLNINDYQKIDIRKCDGLTNIGYTEFDILIISGIGADLMINILANINDYYFKYLLLSPQTKTEYFRQWLINNNLYISDEKIVLDDEIYYFIFKITKNINNIEQKYDESEILYSKYLLKNKDKVLYRYLHKQINHYEKILTSIINTNNIEIYNRYKNLYDITKNILNKW